MLPRNQRMELLSKAYVRAIAAQAGCICTEVNPDFGIDLSIRNVLYEGGRYVDEGAFLEVQLKSTTLSGVRLVDGKISYDLAVRNYEHLRRTGNAPAQRILVLYLMPEDETGWMIQAGQGMSLHHCCYYLSLQGRPETMNENTVAVTIPQTNVFSVNYLQQFPVG